MKRTNVLIITILISLVFGSIALVVLALLLPGRKRKAAEAAAQASADVAESVEV